ncbi:MAG: phytanoyl-CoA dioxygenase family protein [Cyanobacteriota bacterium]|nr:phytanoyl-CoA dioxygenase family protein [Cyanobacteriota bacterium]
MALSAASVSPAGLKQLAGKAMRPSRAFEYIFGRFYSVRLARKKWLRALSPERQPLRSQARSMHLSSTLDQGRVLSDLKVNGASEGLALSAETLQRFHELISRADSFDAGLTRNRISLEEARAHNSGDQTDKYLILDYKSPELDQLARDVANDPYMIHVARSFLGQLTGIETRVQSSLVTDATVEYREQSAQTVTFHYDVHGYNFLYCFFYLTDCDETSGAHEMIVGSHRRKSLRFLLSTARKAESTIYRYYPDLSRVIKGPAGSGFFEDTSCFHRALAPSQKERICLQIRYKG